MSTAELMKMSRRDLSLPHANTCFPQVLTLDTFSDLSDSTFSSFRYVFAKFFLIYIYILQNIFTCLFFLNIYFTKFSPFGKCVSDKFVVR
ncbi:hypothetical protein BRARA_F00101 [Brassica rapa]|uniref:Uncharacterized protein n=1 Tax=Brassica campestris TaxID=3711 RepID=A0A397Z305_BRACM|nr:hypothetical protein BRARA_F00101 [Brassica rapa]